MDLCHLETSNIIHAIIITTMKLASYFILLLAAVALMKTTEARKKTRACKKILKSVDGTIKSPKYPKYYPKKSRCFYTIKTGYYITFSCSVFKLQNPRKGICKSDYMMVVSGKSKKKYCGRKGPSFTSTSKTVRIIFKSNRKKQYKGFSCSYQSIIPSPTPASTPAPTPSPAPTTAPTPAPTTAPTLAPTTTPITATLFVDAVSAYNAGARCVSRAQSTCGCAGNTSSELYNAIVGNDRMVVSNGIPNHVYEDNQSPNPNTACPHDVYMAVPANPTRSSNFTAYGIGRVGLAVSGGFLYNAVLKEEVNFDSCTGHSDSTCSYHYHQIPTCISGGSGCTLVGYMTDGFPVYSLCSHPTLNRSLISCYYQIDGTAGTAASDFTFNQTDYDNGNCDLDMANGYTFSDNRGYVYLMTADYPFIMPGYYGSKSSQICYIY